MLSKQQFQYQSVRIQHSTDISVHICLGLDSPDYQTQTWIGVKGPLDD